MNNYKHGVYGEYIPSNEKIDTTGDTVPIYIGVAPVHRVMDMKNTINTPILINNSEEAKRLIGYSLEDDFDKHTLSAAVFAHFSNSIKPIGPIILINVLDPNEHKSTTTKQLTPIKNRIILEEDTIISSVSIEDKELGVDFELEQDVSNGKINIIFLKDISEELNVTYSSSDALVTNNELIGSYNQDTGETKGVYCIHDVYEKLKIIPNTLCVPKHGKEIDIRNTLLRISKNISGQWDSVIYTDLDLDLLDHSKAIKLKEDKAFKSIDEKLCWPMGSMQGRKMFMSVLALVATQQTDVKNGGAPSESPSNKAIDITGLVNKDGNKVYTNITLANKLNANGITTALYYGGKWVLWGPHMSNFIHGETLKPEEIFDVNRRMAIYLNNNFKKRNAENVDVSMNRNDIDSILNNEQIILNSLVSEGKLSYGKIEFIETSNSDSDLKQGNFVFDTLAKSTTPAKSLTQRVQYSSQDTSKLFGGGKNENR